MTAFDLTDSIHGIHHRLVAQLRERRNLPHKGTAGDEGELLWLGVLEAHLPRRYAVRRGLVIDSRGERSDALDLIIYDPQYTPVFLSQDEHAYIFAEAVYATFEVKYEINKANIDYAADKAASVRRLHRTNGKIVQAGGDLDKGKTKPPFPIIAGLLALSLPDTWQRSPEARLHEHVSAHLDSPVSRLDLVLGLEGGFLELGQDPTAQPRFEQGPTTFVAFLYALLHRLQQLGTVPAVEWSAYRARLHQPGEGHP